MLIERTPSRHADALVEINPDHPNKKSEILVRVVTRITRQAHPHLFPVHSFDPLGLATVAEGISYMMGGIQMQTFTGRGSVTVPRVLVDVVLQAHPQALWDVQEERLYASKNGRVVAIIDANSEAW